MPDIKINYTQEEIDKSFQALHQAKELSQRGQKADAEKLYKKLIAQFPNYYAAHRGLAGLYIEREEYTLAFQHLAITLGSDNFDYYSMINMEALTFELGMFETGCQLSQAIEKAGDTLGLKRHSDVHYFNKGHILLKSNEYEKAAVEFKKCLRLKPDNEKAALKLIECYKHTGKFQQGLELTEKFLNNKCKRRDEFICLLSDFPAPLISKNINRYLSLAETIEPLDDEVRLTKLFALARYYHINGAFGQSWATISEANNLVKKGVSKHYLNDAAWEKQLLRWAKNARFKKQPVPHNAPKTLPLYILGPSRSGKTSLEAALSWLPGLSNGYENKMLSNSTLRAFNAGDRLPSGYLPFLPDALMPEFVNFYRSEFRKYAQDASIYTTTTPGLVSSVPAIIHALPNAKFIFLQRNHKDIALRMYFTHYRHSNHHAYDFSWSMNYIKWYYEMVEIWRKKFPQAVIVVDYKTLVTETESQIKKILDFLGISEQIPGDLNIPDDSGFSEPYLDRIPAKS